MQIINAVLLFLALVFIWGAMNLDRAPVTRIQIDGSTQLNDSIEFLRKLRGKSPNEESQSRRINAYRTAVNDSMNENPTALSEIEANFEEGLKANSKAINKINKESSELFQNMEQIVTQSQNSKLEMQEQITNTSSNLSEMVGLIMDIKEHASRNNTQSDDLKGMVSEVKVCVGF